MDKPGEERGVFIVPFYSGVVIGGIVVSGLTYLIPVYLKILGYGGVEIGLGGTLMSVPYVLMTLLLYPMYSIFKDARLYSISALLISGATLLLLSTDALPIIYLAQIIIGASLAIYYPVAEIIITKLYPPDKRAKIYGFFGASWSIGYLVGPSLSGSLLGSVGIQTTFIALLLLSLLSFLSLLWFKVKLSVYDEEPKIVKTRIFSLFLAATSIFSGMTAVIVSVLPGIAKGVGYDASFIGYSYSLFSLSRLIGFLLVSRTMMRPTLSKISATALGSVLPLMMLIRLDVQALLPLSLFMLGILVSLFNSLTYLYMTSSIGGDTMYIISRYEFYIGIGFLTMPIVAGTVADNYGAEGMINLTMALCATAGLVMASMIPQSRRSSSQS